jgi:hypothetical protein
LDLPVRTTSVPNPGLLDSVSITRLKASEGYLLILPELQNEWGKLLWKGKFSVSFRGVSGHRNIAKMLRQIADSFEGK